MANKNIRYPLLRNILPLDFDLCLLLWSGVEM